MVVNQDYIESGKNLLKKYFIHKFALLHKKNTFVQNYCWFERKFKLIVRVI